jgi:hypothetical protein
MEIRHLKVVRLYNCALLMVFGTFHWVFSEEKKEIMGNYVYFLCSLIFILCFYDKIIISISVHYILIYQAVLPIVYTLTPTHLPTLLARHCTYFWAI